MRRLLWHEEIINSLLGTLCSCLVVLGHNGLIVVKVNQIKLSALLLCSLVETVWCKFYFIKVKPLPMVAQIINAQYKAQVLGQ